MPPRRPRVPVGNQSLCGRPERTEEGSTLSGCQDTVTPGALSWQHPQLLPLRLLAPVRCPLSGTPQPTLASSQQPWVPPQQRRDSGCVFTVWGGLWGQPSRPCFFLERVTMHPFTAGEPASAAHGEKPGGSGLGEPGAEQTPPPVPTVSCSAAGRHASSLSSHLPQSWVTTRLGHVLGLRVPRTRPAGHVAGAAGGGVRCSLEHAARAPRSGGTGWPHLLQVLSGRG